MFIIYNVKTLVVHYNRLEIINLLLKIIELSISERAVIDTIDMYIESLYITAEHNYHIITTTTINSTITHDSFKLIM